MHGGDWVSLAPSQTLHSIGIQRAAHTHLQTKHKRIIAPQTNTHTCRDVHDLCIHACGQKFHAKIISGRPFCCVCTGERQSLFLYAISGNSLLCVCIRKRRHTCVGESPQTKSLCAVSEYYAQCTIHSHMLENIKLLMRIPRTLFHL